MTDKYVLGVDFGSESVRCVLIGTSDGKCVAEYAVNYPRWQEGRYCNPEINQYRQHPMDYIESLERVVSGCLSQIGQDVLSRIVGISFDTTASTPVLTDKSGTPLALRDEYSDNPNAMFVLWKDHTAIREADEINEAAKKWSTDYTMYSGGSYSCEWTWAKMLHCLREDHSLRKDAYSWVEHCDWICALLVGDTTPEKIHRSRCAAGHKAMWNECWGGLPDMDFFVAIDPIYELFRGHLYNNTAPNGICVGVMDAIWLKRFGINQPIKVGIGAIDCHIGAIGAGIKEGTLVKVVGTSTCDIAISPAQEINSQAINGICGQVRGSVLPDRIGYEAGQAAFGDLYSWFARLISWNKPESISDCLNVLTEAAQKLPKTERAPLFLDWLNGRRSPLANLNVSGAITGLYLSTSAPSLFASLVESSCFGARAIVEYMRKNGIPINRIVATGGIARKSPYVMQTMSDVLQLPIEIVDSDQTCALGAAICAAVAAGVYPNLVTAQQYMSVGISVRYMPDRSLKRYYDTRFLRYSHLGKFEEQKK